MKNSVKKLFAIFALLVSGSVMFAENDMSFGENFTSLEGHRFIEVKGAIPVFPVLTSHGVVQSFVVGFSDVFGEMFTGEDGNYDHYTPKLATDLNIIVYPPIANYHIGFMCGVAIDTWEQNTVENSVEVTNTHDMNYFYGGVHIDYGHWVLSSIGTRISIYGEYTMGWIASDFNGDKEKTFCFDICPFGLQFCPEKHFGIYFEIPHFGGRPFFQTGVSIGL
ncbi:hypothetical protein [Treponema sp.]|uniref:hypothetical protein n=1 Tax=Treponema sp. TaxID=166 RepID=UPI003890FD0A